jgi:phytoene synthase
MTSDAHYAECGAQLKERDRDLWLSCLFAPQPARQHIHAIYAFALETADVRGKVSQPLLGEMRLRWWADAITAETTAGEGARAHPVADALLDTIERYELPREEIVALIDAHIFDLYDDPLASRAALEDYCRLTVTAPMRWAARILGANLATPAARAFDLAGAALGLTRLMRALPANADGQSFLPLDLLKDHGVTAEQIRARADSQSLRAALAMLRHDAQAKYEAARAAAAELAAGREALLPAATTPLFLERMSRSDYHPFQPLAEPSPLRRQWRLWRAARGVGL